VDAHTGKCLVSGFQALFYGGGSVFTPTTGTITQFRRQDEEIGGWTINKGSGGIANVKRVFAPTGNPADQEKLDGAVSATKRQKGCKAYGFRTDPSRSLTDDSADQGNFDGTVEACGPDDRGTKDIVGSGESENPKPGTQEDLTKIDQEGRNRKATKSDDAEVLEYIWYDHVFQDGARTWTEAQKKAFPCAARILQEAMLKFWKKRVRRSFLAWLRAKYKDLAELDKEYARCVKHRDGRWHFVELSRNTSLKERSKVGLAGYCK
jgi:hypothetical protein